MKKILAIILAAVLVLSFAACKKNDTNNDTTAGDAQTSGQAADVSASDETASSEEASSEVETEVVTDKEGHTVIETKAPQSSDTKTATKGNSTTPSKGLNTNDAAACVKAYQEAVKKTKQFKSGRQNMALKGSITADGSLGALLKIAQKPVANALNKNSKDRTDIPGKPSGMQASHMKSASAVTNGNYTTITFNVKDQTQGAKADNHSGSVGCAVGTLGDVDNAIRELGLSVDYKDGKIELTYTNCKVVVKIDNTTGKIVEGSWAYDVNVYANGIKVSVVSVNNLKGIVAFSYTAKG
ncbi:MAG: hypothetical protein PUE45_02225 [Oscillospiraceae bacterium]|nr:hypothetical protein [Oscillospiraceae bacterium]